MCFHFWILSPEGEKEGASEWLHVAWLPGDVKPQQPFWPFLTSVFLYGPSENPMAKSVMKIRKAYNLMEVITT